DPSVGKSALALVVDAGSDFLGAEAIVHTLAGVGGLGLEMMVGEREASWEGFDDCVKAAIDARIPLWLRATKASPTRAQYDQVLDASEDFLEVDTVLEMAKRAHALGHRGLVLSVDAFDSTPSYLIRANRLLSSCLSEVGRKYP